LNEPEAMRRLRVTAEYGCAPIWDLDKNPPVNLNGTDLGLSDQLSARLEAWSERFQRTLNQEYPPFSGFETQAAAREFDDEGAHLAREIEEALGGNASVSYLASAIITVES
jgi:hypothetical protein